MRLILVALAWLAQFLGLGAAGAALNDPALLQDHGQLVVALLGLAVAAAGGLPSYVGQLRAWWQRVRDAAGGAREGGFADVQLLSLLAAVVLALSLGGCGTVLPEAPRSVSPASAATPAEAAQATINAALVGIISLAQTIEADEQAGILTPNDAYAYRARLRILKRDLDVAHGLLVTGDLDAARNRTEIVTRGLNEVRAWIAARAAGRRS